MGTVFYDTECPSCASLIGVEVVHCSPKNILKIRECRVCGWFDASLYELNHKGVLEGKQ